MEIFKELTKIPELSIALGFFDGVHLGHQAVIKNSVQFAEENGLKSAVITFQDHPHCYFYGVCPKYILTRKMREKRIEELGVDYLFELDFESISGLTADEYLKDILIKYFTPHAITTGWNHNFGYKKSGDVKYLAQNSTKFDYKYFEIPPQKVNGKVISSTEIRNCLAGGKIENANQMLGYKYSISGEVVHGKQLGRTIGFRTANIVYPPELIDLPFGVYSTIVKLGNETFNGITNFGIRPTVSDTKQRSLETHIINFDRDIYGQNIEIDFLKMLRHEKKFASVEELKKQIANDILQIK